MSTTTKPINQKARVLILPMVICEACSAVLPLLVVVDLSMEHLK